MAQGGRDRRERNASDDGREAVSDALQACLGAFDTGIGHVPSDLPVGGRPRLGQGGLPANGIRLGKFWRSLKELQFCEAGIGFEGWAGT